ncbi:MAG: FKBP-type peptidyl-prolyl cis-trans isomerase [Sedimentisphaerales bacterium]
MSKKWINGMTMLAVGLLVVAAGCKTVSTPAVMPDKAAVAAPAPSAKPGLVLETPMDKMSYSLGVETAKNFKKQQIEINLDAMYQGMKDATDGDKFLMDDKELNDSYAMFQSMVRAVQIRARMNVGSDNKKKGAVFLEENKTKDGVVTLPSGLQYKILKKGTGHKPKDTDTVECYYRGTLIDGTEFDSSAHSNNEGFPAMVNLASCIPGWREAIPLMPVGSKWQLFIPPELAYGINSSGRYIGPNATLIFEVELVAIK